MMARDGKIGLIFQASQNLLQCGIVRRLLLSLASAAKLCQVGVQLNELILGLFVNIDRKEVLKRLGEQFVRSFRNHLLLLLLILNKTVKCELHVLVSVLMFN
jgi:hypothetical protein